MWLTHITSSRIIHTIQPENDPFSKENLKKKLTKENKKWERQLSMAGKFSISKSMLSRWGIKTLNDHFVKSRGDLRSVQTASKKVDMMGLTDGVFDFIDSHKLALKGQSDKGSGIRFALNLRKRKDGGFQVKVGKKGGEYGVKFSSKEPYMSKSMKVVSEEDLHQKMGKFLRNSLRQWKKYSARRLSLQPRKLIAMDQVPGLMKELAGEEMEVKDVEGENEGKEFDLVHKEDGVLLAKIKLVEEKEELPMIEMSNDELEDFKHMQKVANRTVAVQDTKEDLVLFFRPHFEEYLNRYNTWKLSRIDLNKLSEIVKDEAQDMKFIKDLEEEVLGDEKDPTMIILRHWKDKGVSAYLQVNMYRLNEDYLAMHIIEGSNELEIQVPRTMNQQQKNETMRSVKKFLTDEDYLRMVDFKDAKIQFVDLIELMDCKKPKVEQESEIMIVYSIEESEGCPFSRNTFVLNNVDFDGLRYIHLVLDNDYFKGEHFITMTTEAMFRDNLNKVLKESRAEFKTVEDAYKRSQEPVKTELTDIINKINQLMEGKVKESDKDGVKIYKAKVYNRDVVVIKVKQIPIEEGPDLFKITTFDVNLDRSVKKSRAHHEFILYENNGYDQMHVLETELKKIAADIPE